VALAVLTIATAFSDLRTRTIPNRLVPGALILDFGMTFYLFHWTGIGRSALCAGLAIAVYLPLFVGAVAGALRAPHFSARQLDVGHPRAITLPHGAVIGNGPLLFLTLLGFGLLYH
jgi:Flp pilus assembly protein protease CpaA